MKMKDKIVAGFVVALLAVVGFVWFSPAGLKQIPDLTLEAIDGRTIKFRELSGRPLIITFWATTCPGCIKEMPHLIELYEELAAKGLEIVGIAMYYDPPNQVMTMARQRGIPYPIVLDQDKSALRAFGIRDLTPNSFLVAPDGRVVYHKVGEMDMGKVKKQIVYMLAVED